MKKLILLFLGTATLIACNSGADNQTEATTGTAIETHTQAGVHDETSDPNVVQVAISSPDHSTLVEAVKAADLVTSLSNAGPFTVFAPTNAAFDKLPKGTFEDLLKPENRNALVDILQHHVYVGVLKADQLMDGQTLGMVDGRNIKITIVDGKPVINGKAHIVASVPASNGIVHVIDEVITPEAK